jgi:hypothetical protein
VSELAGCDAFSQIVDVLKSLATMRHNFAHQPQIIERLVDSFARAIVPLRLSRRGDLLALEIACRERPTLGDTLVDLLRQIGMSAKGNAYDNAKAESLAENLAHKRRCT